MRPRPQTIRPSGEQLVKPGGFTTLELLIASALLLVVTGAIATLVQPIADSMEKSLGRADLTGGGRAVIDRLATEIREAGSPAAVAIDRVRPGLVAQTVTTLADLESEASALPGQAIRILRIPHLARQGVVSGPVASGSVFVPLNAASACSAVSPACGFLPGMTALLHDEAQALLVTVHSASDTGVVRLMSPVASGFDAGAVLGEVVVTTYGLRAEPDGAARLVRVRHGVDQPVIQQVVDFEVETRGADPMRIRSVSVRLRLEAAAHLRGPTGVLFRRAGTARRVRSWVPDVEWATTIALRQGES